MLIFILFSIFRSFLILFIYLFYGHLFTGIAFIHIQTNITQTSCQIYCFHNNEMEVRMMRQKSVFLPFHCVVLNIILALTNGLSIFWFQSFRYQFDLIPFMLLSMYVSEYVFVNDLDWIANNLRILSEFKVKFGSFSR